MSYVTAAPIGAVIGTLEVVEAARSWAETAEERAARKAARLEREMKRCAECRSLEGCQYGPGGRGYHPDWEGDPSYMLECAVHKAWGERVRMERALEESGLPKQSDFDLRELLFSHHPAELEEVLQGLNEVYEGREHALVLEGASGRGKTDLLSALGTSLMRRGEAVRYRTSKEVVSALRFNGEGYEGALRELLSAKYLLLDEVGEERLSEYNEEQLEVVLSRRVRGRRATVIATRGHRYRGRLEELLRGLRRIEV